MKKIVILGSTGSIGRNALSAVKNLGAGYKVLGLAANSRIEGLLAQVKAFRPRYVSVFDYNSSQRIKGFLPRGVKLLGPGVEGLSEMASLEDADIVLNAVTGAVGFAPLVAAIRASKQIALANKEPMVMAGPALMKEAARWQAKLIPVDSEPSAIFQCLAGVKDGEYDAAVSRIFLTASGGPFYVRAASLSTVTVKEALDHPRWNMGPKITVDSSTLMNKGLEAIEISNLFALPLEKIQVLVHPQSVMHSGVEFTDGSVLAQLSWPDMRLPIQYALTWPQRRVSLARPLDFYRLVRLEFSRPDFKKFPCLGLALWAGAKGGAYPAVLNASNEVAVEKFLKGEVRFTDIALIVEKTLFSHHESGPRVITLSEAVETDQWAREKASEAASRIKKIVRAKKR